MAFRLQPSVSSFASIGGCGVTLTGVAVSPGRGQNVEWVRASVELRPGGGGVVRAVHELSSSRDPSSRTASGALVAWLRPDDGPFTLAPAPGHIAALEASSPFSSYAVSQQEAIEAMQALMVSNRLAIGFDTAHAISSFSGRITREDGVLGTTRNCIDRARAEWRDGGAKAVGGR